MRFGIGLIALLMGVGLMLWLQADSAKTVTTAAKPARMAAEEIAGQELRGTYDVKNVETNGRFSGLEFTRIDERSILLRMYDVKVGDQIVEIGPLAARDYDSEMMRAQLMEVGARQSKLVVLRNGEKIALENMGMAAKMGGKDIPKGQGINGPNGMNIPTH